MSCPAPTGSPPTWPMRQTKRLPGEPETVKLRVMAVADKVKKKDKKGKAKKKQNGEWAAAKHTTLGKKEYEKQLRKLQAELVDLEEWVKYKGLRVVAIFEG